MKKEATEKINQKFYDDLYKSGLFRSIVKILFSFDQAYKAEYIKFHLKKHNSFKEDQSVYDFGMGYAALLFRLPFKHQYGSDISSKAIENYSKLVDKLKPNFFFSEYNLDASSKKFDIVIASHVLEHIPDYKTVFFKLNESVKVKDNGILCIVLPINEVVEDPKHCHVCDEKKIRKDFAKYGNMTLYKFDAITNIILDIEYNKERRLLGKVLRVLFGSLPFTIVRKIDEYLLLRNKPSQILAIFTK